jgi:hypothetical protein
VSDPFEAWTRFREQLSAHREGPTPCDLYKADPDWERQLHHRIDFPLQAIGEFSTLWTAVMEELDAKGIRPGPASFMGWNDGDRASPGIIL